MQLIFKKLVFSFQLNEMRLYRHSKPPREGLTSDRCRVPPRIRSGLRSLHHFTSLSMGIENPVDRFEVACVMKREQGTAELSVPDLRESTEPLPFKSKL